MPSKSKMPPPAAPPEELADPFRPPSDSIPPASGEEKLAPDTEPAPAPHPDTLSEAHGFPRERRCPQE